MADIAPGLNFRIGADVKGVQKAIREAEKSFRGAVSSFSSIGNSLSIALTAPMAAFTGISIKAAGELESLRLALEKTMEGGGRSVEEARLELDELRKAALAPGLDFQQAVKGSIRLQGVGFQAEQARKIIVELANALTLAGGTADQLDGVTKQFTQMVGKGKIMQEDLTIILENMPNLAKVMQDTFGTSNAEMLRKMGVSVEDFISKLTQGMAKLPRAHGGIANAIVNAQNAIKLAIAEVGEEINKTFNVTGALESFARWVGDLGKWFRGLSDETKRTIGAVAVFLATIGPAFKVMQAGVFVVGKLQVAFLMFQKALAMSVTEGGIPTFVAWWKKLDLAMKTSIIGATVAVVLALGAAWYATSKDMSAAAQAQRKLEEVQKASMEAVGSEIENIKLLSKVAGDETKSKGERLAAMNKLIDISPEYQKALKNEEIDTQSLQRTTAKLVATMIAAENAKNAVAEVSKLREQLRNVKEEADLSTWQKLGFGVDVAIDAFQRFGSVGSIIKEGLSGADDAFNPIISAQEKYRMTVAQNEWQLRQSYGAQIDTLTKYAEEQMAIANTVEITAKKTKDLTDATKGAAEQMERVTKIAAFGQLPTLNLIPDSLQSQGGDPFAKMLESVKVATGAMEGYVTVGEQMGEINKIIATGVGDLGNAFLTLSEMFIQHGQVFQGVVAGVAGSMEQLADSGAGIEEMGKGILQSLKKIIGGLIKTGVTAVVTKALLASALNPFAALALGAASGALAQALFNSLINKIKVPALAQGGVLSSPQLVMAGEYAGARTNPEIVTPENKMRDVFSEVMGKFGGTQGGVLTCRVDGDDLLFIVEKAQRKAQRIR